MLRRIERKTHMIANATVIEEDARFLGKRWGRAICQNRIKARDSVKARRPSNMLRLPM
jgi:hypothetical protein